MGQFWLIFGQQITGIKPGRIFFSLILKGFICVFFKIFIDGIYVIKDKLILRLGEPNFTLVP